MTSFVHTHFPQQHQGIVRMEAALSQVGQLSRGFDGARGLAALMLAAVVSALLVAAERFVDANDGAVAAWMVLWVVAFAALALFSAPVRRLAHAMVKGLDGWSADIAQARADQRLWAAARADARVMADLQAAMTRREVAAPRVEAAAESSTRRVSLRDVVIGWQRDMQAARADMQMLRAAEGDHRVMADLHAVAGRDDSVPEVTKTLLRADQSAAVREAGHIMGARRRTYYV